MVNDEFKWGNNNLFSKSFEKFDFKLFVNQCNLRLHKTNKNKRNRIIKILVGIGIIGVITVWNLTTLNYYLYFFSLIRISLQISISNLI